MIETTQTAPRERPILFSAPMVRALLAGTKTQTRRVVNPLMYLVVDGDEDTGRVMNQSDADFGRLAMQYARCPCGQPGDRLWVQESYRIETAGSTDLRCRYLADDTTGLVDLPADDLEKWSKRRFPYRSCPGRFMYRSISRMDLEVTEVRVQRVQEITDEDARAEGVEACEHALPDSYRCAFRSLWDSINGRRPGCAWADSPLVWAVSFRRVRP